MKNKVVIEQEKKLSELSCQYNSYDNSQHTIYMRQVELGLNELSILWINNKIFDQNWEEKCHIGSDVIRGLNINVNFILKLSSDNALSFLRSPFWQRLKNKDTFRIVIDINQENENEGLCLIKGLQQLPFQNHCLIFTNYQIKNSSTLQSKLNSKQRKFVNITSQTELTLSNSKNKSNILSHFHKNSYFIIYWKRNKPQKSRVIFWQIFTRVVCIAQWKADIDNLKSNLFIFNTYFDN